MSVELDLVESKSLIASFTDSFNGDVALNSCFSLSYSLKYKMDTSLYNIKRNCRKYLDSIDIK